MDKFVKHLTDLSRLAVLIVAIVLYVNARFATADEANDRSIANSIAIAKLAEGTEATLKLVIQNTQRMDQMDLTRKLQRQMQRCAQERTDSACEVK